MPNTAYRTINGQRTAKGQPPKHGQPKTLTMSPARTQGQNRNTARATHKAINQTLAKAGAEPKKPRNFNKRLIAHAAQSASA